MKKIYFLLATLLTIPAANQEFDINNIEELDFDTILDNIDATSITMVHRSGTGCTPENIVPALAMFNIPTILQRNFYCRTQPPVTRSILDLPSMRLYQDPCRNWSVFILPFYNQTSKMFLTQNSPYIDSYLNLSADFIEDLNLQTIGFSLNLDDFFPLLGPIRLQERRLGGLFAAYKTYHSWSFGIRMPLYYLERNFFLNEQERAAIKNAPIFQVISGGAASDEEEVEALLTKHLASDKVGFGDTRISALYMLEGPCQELWVGAELTIPTAVAFRKGIYLSTFCKSKPAPPFDFLHLIQLTTPLCGPTLAQNIEGVAIITELGLEALDKLTANLTDRPLGNNGHFSISPTLEHHYHWSDHLQFITYAGLEYLFAADEDRFFIVAKNPAAFNRDYNDTNQANSNLAFLNQQAINTFFPTNVPCTTVTPGIIVKVSTGFCYEGYNCYSMVGYDFWWQAREKLKLNQTVPPLVLWKGIKPSAHQNKIFGYIGGKLHIWDYDVRLGLRGDFTVESRGIGKDFTIALDINVDF